MTQIMYFNVDQPKKYALCIEIRTLFIRHKTLYYLNVHKHKP